MLKNFISKFTNGDNGIEKLSDLNSEKYKRSLELIKKLSDFAKHVNSKYKLYNAGLERTPSPDFIKDNQYIFTLNVSDYEKNADKDLIKAYEFIVKKLNEAGFDINLGKTEVVLDRDLCVNRKEVTLSLPSNYDEKFFESFTSTLDKFKQEILDPKTVIVNNVENQLNKLRATTHTVKSGNKLN